MLSRTSLLGPSRSRTFRKSFRSKLPQKGKGTLSSSMVAGCSLMSISFLFFKAVLGGIDRMKQRQVDTIIFATGYLYSFPFAHSSDAPFDKFPLTKLPPPHSLSPPQARAFVHDTSTARLGGSPLHAPYGRTAWRSARAQPRLVRPILGTRTDARGPCASADRRPLPAN
jgi:hypothetical protein